MNYIRSCFSLLMLAMTAAMANSAIPEGYYTACEGKSGQALLEALCQTISGHVNVGYSGLWTLYQTTDVDENGKIWDMYSTKRWTYKTEQCGSYQYIGDCYNREHSFPKSWFNDASPMVSDAFHIYPTDGKVNGQRSNYPYGECSGGSSVASYDGITALGRLGASTFDGYSGTVFEPDDMYKGDFARSYFYMAACYNDRIASWSSPMLASNSYPAFSSWAVNLLLKWTRQDEVSQKERDRNEAVYASQENRNPFIDYPELAEHIWGNKVGTPWYADEVSDATFTLPVAGTTINLGYAGVGITRSISVKVKGRNLTSSVNISVSGSGYSLTPSSITAAQAIEGYDITISQKGNDEGDAEGTLTLSSGALRASYDITTSIEAGIPLFEATNITDRSFSIAWIYLGDAESYQLDVKQSGVSLSGYPCSIDASAETYTVENLDAATTYTFSLASGSLTSQVRSVTTGAPIPSINLLYDGELTFTTDAGTPSDIAELLVEAENIAGDITVSVAAPFEVSTDKTNWSTTTTLAIEEDRFYLRLNGDIPGEYATTLTVASGECVNDVVEATGKIKASGTTADGIFEDFEELDEYPACYSSCTFDGVALWQVVNGGFGTASQDAAVNGTKVLRMQKATTSTEASLALAEDLSGGIGTVTFDAARWNNSKEANTELTLQYSDDQGATWSDVKTFTISEIEANNFEATVNRTGNGRVRFIAASGSGRWFIDNIGVTGCSGVSAANTLEYHSWDAYCVNGRLVIESAEGTVDVTVYGTDGVLRYRGDIPAGTTLIELPKGLYVVATDTFARRVLVK